jgi:hypothetical protein
MNMILPSCRNHEKSEIGRRIGNFKKHGCERLHRNAKKRKNCHYHEKNALKTLVKS